MPERKAFIFNLQKYNMYDGSGVRTMVFFKGCPLRCKWCSNPEGLTRKYDVCFKESNCTKCGACAEVCPAGIHTIIAGGTHLIDRSKECIGCRRCEEACFVNALQISGRWNSVSELLEYSLEDKAFYDFSGGGVTLGGGEVTSQPEAAVGLLMACKQHDVNTAIETCGYASPEVMGRFAEYTDEFLFDIKGFDSDEHLANTGVRIERILKNLKDLLRNGAKVKARMPLIHGVNDSRANIEGICDFLALYTDRKNFLGVDILPYHRLGENKYKQLDMTYPLEGLELKPRDEEISSIEDTFKKRGIAVTVIRH